MTQNWGGSWEGGILDHEGRGADGRKEIVHFTNGESHGWRGKMLVYPRKGSKISLNPTAKLHPRYRIPLDPMPKSLAGPMIRRISRKKHGRIYDSIGFHVSYKCSGKFVRCFLEHVQYQTMLLNGFWIEHSTISVSRWPGSCWAELSWRACLRFVTVTILLPSTPLLNISFFLTIN